MTDNNLVKINGIAVTEITQKVMRLLDDSYLPMVACENELTRQLDLVADSDHKFGLSTIQYIGYRAFQTKQGHKNESQAEIALASIRLKVSEAILKIVYDSDVA